MSTASSSSAGKENDLAKVVKPFTEDQLFPTLKWTVNRIGKKATKQSLASWQSLGISTAASRVKGEGQMKLADRDKALFTEYQNQCDHIAILYWDFFFFPPQLMPVN